MIAYFSKSYLIYILILILIFSISMISECQGFTKNYIRNSGYIKEDVPSSNTLIIIPEFDMKFNSIPVGASISIDGEVQSQKTPVDKIKIRRPGNYDITLTYNNEDACRSIFINESLSKIEYNFNKHQWNTPYK